MNNTDRCTIPHSRRDFPFRVVGNSLSNDTQLSRVSFAALLSRRLITV